MEFINAHGIAYTPDKWLTFDDVIIMPRDSDIKSRKDPNLSTKLTSRFGMGCPIISANMDTISEKDMCEAMSKHGGVGILHRFYKDFDKFLEEVDYLNNKVGGVCFSVGSSQEHLKIVEAVLKRNLKNPPVVCVDVANGHNKNAVDQVKRLRSTFKQDIQIIGGNVCTAGGTVALVQAGADAIKVGIGCGSHCTTRIVTGCGVPQLSAIMQCRMALTGLKSNAALIADGGIRNTGDIIKALAAGADSVMLGKLLSGTEECPGEKYTKINGRYEKIVRAEDFYNIIYRKYRGQSSSDFMSDINKNGFAEEGESSYIAERGPVEHILNNLIMGIKSGLSYIGARNLEELYNKAIFLEVSNHGHAEGLPHGKV